MGHYRPIIIILYVQQFNVLTGFEPESPGVGSNRCANCATTPTNSFEVEKNPKNILSQLKYLWRVSFLINVHHQNNN